MIKAEKILNSFGYIVATLVILMGTVIIAGLLVPVYIPNQFRYLLGIVFILYGIFRIVTLWTKSQQEKDYED